MTQTLVHDPAQHKLGKHLGVVVDPRTLELKTFLNRRALPTPPKTFDAAKNVDSFPMFANDTVGDCTCAGWGHMIQVWMAASGRAGFDLTDADILRVYSAVTGYDPADPTTDNGAYLLDILNYVRKRGMGSAAADTADNLHKPAGFVKVDHTKPDQLRLAAWLFGGLYVGCALPISAQSQQVWDVPAGGTTGDGAPGSWGGHCFTMPTYRSKDWDGITWGMRKKMTDAFVTAYVDEVYGVVDHDWINRKGWKAPNGFKYDELVKALAQFGSQAVALG